MVEDREPGSECFDVEECTVENGGLRRRGVTVTLRCASEHDLDRVVMRSDTAYLTVPEVGLESPPGTARYTDLRTILVEARDRIETASVGFLSPSGASENAVQQFLAEFNQVISGVTPCTIVIDDPTGRSYFRKDNTLPPPNVSVRVYVRTANQNEELGIEADAAANLDEPLPIEDAVEKVKELIESSSRIAMFTGAGVSTESGVPAFRSSLPGHVSALWDRFDTSNACYQRFLEDEDSRIEHWDMHACLWDKLREATPNPAHRLAARLHDRHKLLSLVTQNIDGLHQAAGVPTEKVCELHGTMLSSHCLTCGHRVATETLLARRKPGDPAPHCGEAGCGGSLKPDTVSFGEALDPKLLLRARDDACKADLMLVMGTSLTVEPANELPALALRHGIPVVLVNQGETSMDHTVTLHVPAPCGEFASAVMHLLAW
eukprot:TRINITY_DN967_c0_g1_i2.p1 TRINITY_DN967_c0_g1~~TRINITY_DN967_c0_g1_i2.p1  ORF type:complete len:463 (+),score=95.95 TRINITY_DN967_c0_g1_i2:92-1390(+)